MTILGTSTRTQRHLVRIDHAATGSVISAVRLAPVAWPPFWSHRIVDGTVVVTGPLEGVGAEHIDVIVSDGAIAQVIDFPPPEPGQPGDSFRVPLTTTEVTVHANPKAMTLIVAVDNEDGPSHAIDVTIKAATGGATQTLTETPVGVYSATRVWDTNFVNADVLVAGVAVRKVTLDYTRIKTRIHVVQPA